MKVLLQVILGLVAVILVEAHHSLKKKCSLKEIQSRMVLRFAFSVEHMKK